MRFAKNTPPALADENQVNSEAENRMSRTVHFHNRPTLKIPENAVIMHVMDKQTKTLSVRVRDKHAPLLRRMAFEVNQVWNAANAESTEFGVVNDY